MADNGVSLPTTISQVDNVAKTQLKAQQPHHPASPLAEELDQSRAMKVERVQKADKAEKGRIHSDEEKDRRRREHPPSERRARGDADAEAAPEAAPTEPPEGLGLHVDTKA